MTIEKFTAPLSKGFSRALMEMLGDGGIPGSMILTPLLTESFLKSVVDRKSYERTFHRDTIEAYKQISVD